MRTHSYVRSSTPELATAWLLALVVTACALVAAFFVVFTPPAGLPSCGDFVGFYVPAQMVRSVPDRLYDLDLQRDLRIQVTGVDGRLPYAHAPFLAVLLAPLGALPFRVAYAVWALVSGALYGVSVLLIAPPDLRRWALPLAFVCPIFGLYVMAAGQVTAVDCIAVSAAVYLERKGRLYLSGMALTLCAHKPTLLIFAVLMLVLTRHFRTIAGVFSGLSILATVSVMAVGKATCIAWLELVLWWGKAAGQGGYFSVSRYVDIISFYRMLHTPPVVSAVIAFVLGAISLTAIAFMWRSDRRELAWAGTLIAPLVLNVYAGRYETVLLALALILVCCVERRDPALVLIAVSLAAILSPVLAERIGLQPLTLVSVLTLVYGAHLTRRIRTANFALQKSPSSLVEGATA